jgi:hypothetical protein
MSPLSLNLAAPHRSINKRNLDNFRYDNLSGGEDNYSRSSIRRHRDTWHLHLLTRYKIGNLAGCDILESGPPVAFEIYSPSMSSNPLRFRIKVRYYSISYFIVVDPTMHATIRIW